MTITQTRFCESCGAATTGAKFCEVCGAPIATVEHAVVGAADAAASPFAVGASSVRISTVLWALAVVVHLLLQAVPWLPGVFGWNYVLPLLALAGLLVVVGSAAVIFEGGSVGARVGGIALVVVAAASTVVLGGFAMRLGLGVALLFLAWALTRPLRGLGYLALIAAYLPALLLSWLSAGLAYSLAPVSVALFLLAWAAVPVGSAILAMKLSERSERAALLRPPPVAYQPPVGYAPVAQPAAYGQPVGYAPGYLPPTNGTAIASLVLAILGFGLIAIILGYSARTAIRRTGERGDGLATAGIVIGWIGIASGVLAVVIYLVFFLGFLGMVGVFS